MVNYFVNPKTNETISSISGRYHKIVNWLPLQSLNMELFDESDYKNSIRFPVKLASFHANTKHICGWSIADILNNFTLWNLYLQFVDPKKKEELKTTILTSNSDNPLREPILSVPYYCPKCVKTLSENREEMHWNRLHQIPYIQICTTHRCYLKQVDIRHAIGLKYPLLIPAFDLCPINNPRQCNSTLKQKIAERIVNLTLGEASVDTNYRQRFIALGYSSFDKINRIKIQNQFNEFYSKGILDSYGQKSTSVLSLIDGDSKIDSIITHILLDYFILNHNPSEHKIINKSKPIKWKHKSAGPDQRVIETNRRAFLRLFGKENMSFQQRTKSNNARRWLKKYDTPWFQKNYEILQARFENQKQSDKGRLDNQHLASLKNARQKLIRLNPSQRISAISIKKMASVPRDLGPISSEFLLKNSETLYEYRVRKIKQRALYLISTGQKLTARNLLLNYNTKTRNEMRPFTIELIATLGNRNS